MVSTIYQDDTIKIKVDKGNLFSTCAVHHAVDEDYYLVDMITIVGDGIDFIINSYVVTKDKHIERLY